MILVKQMITGFSYAQNNTYAHFRRIVAPGRLTPSPDSPFMVSAWSLNLFIHDRK